MRLSLRRCIWVLVVCLPVFSITAFAQASDLGQNLDDCRSGREPCDRSKLSSTEAAKVDTARHELMLSDCKNGAGTCDYSKLTPFEAKEVSAAELRHNAQKCENGWDECDRSKLTPSQARQTVYSEH